MLERLDSLCHTTVLILVPSYSFGLIGPSIFSSKRLAITLLSRANAMTTTTHQQRLLPLLVLLALSLSRAFRLLPQSSFTLRSRPLFASPKNKDGSSYQFGDLTRGFLKSATSKINKLTGKEEYQFGDLSRWLDEQAKGKVGELTGKGDYEVGDLTKWVQGQAMERVTNFTGREDYAFGDISKELLRRVKAGEYELQDVWLALRVLLSVGASLTPIASALPVKWLLELVNLGLAQDISGRLLEVLAKSLDERIKEALVGDSKYKLGDLSKRKLQSAVASFTGKDSYTVGDITKRIVSLSQANKKSDTNKQEIVLGDDLSAQLEDWDARFLDDQTERSKL